ncbi:MAG: glycosyltransferase family 39 protein [Elusimicrobia bacterium]|nr:glycosyltransferase family 39 protein [Elusimicrobiota bacterium]
MQFNNDEYETIARQIVARGNYYFFHPQVPGADREPGVPTAAREPGLPFFIAAVYLVCGVHPFAVLIAQCLLGAATCWLVGLLARRLAGESAQLIAVAVTAFYPYGIYYCAYFLRESLACFLVAAALLLMVRFLDEPRPAAALAAGLVSGLCAVTFSSWLLITGALALAIAGLALRRARLAAALLLSAWALFPGAWTLRNYAVFGRFIPGSTLAGFNFYTALIVPEEYRGTAREIEFERGDPKWSAAQDMLLYYPMDDGRQQEAFMKAAREHIRARPGEYLAHAGRQAVKLWRFYPYPRQYPHSYRLIKAASLLSDGWLIPLGLLGLVLFWRRSGDVRLYAAMLLLGTGVYALVSAIVRYRLPMMLPLIALSAAVLAEAWERRQRRA